MGGRKYGRGFQIDLFVATGLRCQCVLMKVDRPLTEEERQFLIWLLEHGKPEANQYLSQVPDVSVVGVCECGCPTIDLAVKGKSFDDRWKGGNLILSNYLGTSPEGASIGVMLHACRGLLAELEVFKFVDDKQKISLPPPDTLTPGNGTS